VILSELVAALEILVLERLPDGRFALRGVLPAWGRSLARLDPLSDEPLTLAEVFPVAAVFLETAEAVWSGEQRGARSDFWTEIGANGERIHLEASAVSSGGTSVLVIVRNDRLFAQQELVLQRARELRLSHRELMRETEEKDVLVHAIVHDLAAPLHSMLGALSLADETLRQEAAHDWIQLAVQAALRQRELIGDILAVFSAERGGTDATQKTMVSADLDPVIETVRKEGASTAKARDVTLSVAAFPRCRVIAERGRLVRVLSNLVENAIRYSPQKGTVRIGAHREPDSVLIEVEDQGPGVPVEALGRLFQKLGRGRDKNAGTGLGLYFCRITVERWGGAIGYQAAEQGGARFWIRLAIDSSREGIRDGQAASPR
jgi:signal transduction histidine kinase